jgi:DNA-binding PucR family transcriptional regulator
MSTAWSPPSPRCAELLREVAERMLGQPDFVTVVDAAVLERAGEAITADPVLADALRAGDQANLLHWLHATIRDPGAPVPPNVAPATLAIARELVRRGLDDRALEAYRAGQNVAWTMFMRGAFEVTADPGELQELLDTGARSIFAFVDATLSGIEAEIDREREQLTSGTHAERLEVVNLLVGGAPIPEERASARLGYDLRRRHTAAILWGDAAAPDQGLLGRTADALARAAGAERAFTVVAGAAALWVWLGTDAGAPDPAALERALTGAPGVRLAVGSTGAGADGFRRGHLDALATQRLMHRRGAAVRFARYEEVRAVALAADEERALEFAARTLGDLAGAPETLRETLRTWLREGGNTTATARALPAHRNTVIARLGRARDLLPLPLEGNGLEVGLALEIVRWFGVPAGAAREVAAPRAA